MQNHYDFVVIGGGSAGCVVASRLAASGTARVLLLEAGRQSKHWTITMPSAFGENFEGGSFNWSWWTVPQHALGGRRVFMPAGRVVGGSSAINGMVFLRGHPLDFKRWAEHDGADGWSWNDVLPYFKKLESYEGPINPQRGTSGPIRVRPGAPTTPVERAFLEAGRQAGYASTEEVNGGGQEGFGPWDANIAAGRRAGAAEYLERIQHPGLTIESNAFVTRVLTHHGEAIGAEFVQGGQLRRALAASEVILCAGALRTPQLLMLSGIGPEPELARHGIDVVAHSPSVGTNLQDHIYAMVQYLTKDVPTLNQYRRLDRRVRVGARWFLTHDGVAATNHIEVGAFLRLSDDAAHPDGQIHFKAVLLDGWKISPRNGVNFGVSTMRPHSTGTVRLANADPHEAPLIDPNFLASEKDLTDAVALVDRTRELAAMPAFHELLGEEVAPGRAARERSAVEDFLRRSTGSGFHPSCTCRMGRDDAAVCDPDLTVRGVARLRIADASVFPSIVSANTHATTLMVAERASALVQGQSVIAGVASTVPEAAEDAVRGAQEARRPAQRSGQAAGREPHRR